jgi:hypothetical protein
LTPGADILFGLPIIDTSIACGVFELRDLQFHSCLLHHEPVVRPAAGAA